jgi:RNA polymerase sigma-70 factor (ECF subfamily)
VRFVDDAALVEGLRAGHPTAMAEFHDRFARPVQRILWGILGPDQELSDLHHDVFVRALASLGKLRAPDALGGWVNTIAVHTAQACLEKRISRRRWVGSASTETLPEASSSEPGAQLDAREALRAIHALLEQLCVEDRIAFALRHLDGFELTEVAEACQVSLATIKRRLSRAEEHFARLVASSPVLAEQIKGRDTRWNRR